VPFDPSQSFEVIEPSTGFDPSEPFEVIGDHGDPPAFVARATGYHPIDDPSDPEFKMEGGRIGAAVWHGKKLARQEPLFTLDQFRRGEAPYVSVAMDNTKANPIPYGTMLESPDLPGVPLKIMDTGSAFRGKGTSRIDIARDTKEGANADENNRPLRFVQMSPDRSAIGEVPERALIAGEPPPQRRGFDPSQPFEVATDEGVAPAQDQGLAAPALSGGDIRATIGQVPERALAAGEIPRAAIQFAETGPEVRRAIPRAIPVSQPQQNGFDPTQPFEVINEESQPESKSNGFDPSKPFEVISEGQSDEGGALPSPDLPPESMERLPPAYRESIPGAGLPSWGEYAAAALGRGDFSEAARIAGKATAEGVRRGLNLPVEGPIRAQDIGEIMAPSGPPLVGREYLPREEREPVSVAGTVKTAGYNLLVDTVNFFNSPEGAAITAATGGASALKPVIGRFVALGFGADSARHAIDAAREGRWADALESLGLTALLSHGAQRAAKAEFPVNRPVPRVVTPGEAAGLEPIAPDLPGQISAAPETARVAPEVTSQRPEVRADAEAVTVATEQPAPTKPTPLTTPAVFQTSGEVPAMEGARQAPPESRPLSREEKARAEYHRELEAEARELQSDMGDELIDAVVKAGGLPSKLNPNRKAYSGELAILEESARDPNRQGPPLPPINKLFTAGAAHPDELATRLRDRGFNVQRPDELLDLIDTRMRTGKEIFGQPASAEFYSPKATEAELVDIERQGRDLVREFQGEYGGGILSREARETLAKTIAARNVEEEFTAEGVTSPQARKYGQELVADYVQAARSGKLPTQARYPIYRSDFGHRPHQYIMAGDHALRIVEESLAETGFKPKEDLYFSPRKRRGGIAPIPPPAVPPGQVLTMGGDLPVTLPRTRPGSVAAADVMNALKNVMVTAGSVGEIRRGRFAQRAKGVFKSQSEIVRLEHIDDVPTAIHETGHALMKQFYGTVKSRGLKWTPSAVRRELIGLGKELYGNRKPVAGYASEGFSEFVRHYLTSENAHKIAPNTYKFFEEGVMVDHPEVAAQLRAARGLIDVYRFQGALARANSQVVREPGWTRRTLNALRDFLSFQRIAESAEPLRQLSIEAKQRLGKPLPPSADPYKLFKMKRGASGPILERMVENNMVDVWGNPTGPSLKEALSEVRSQRNEFLLYLFARRAQERWSKGLHPGITKEDANYIRQTLESPAFDRAAVKYYRWWDGVLNYLGQADPAMDQVIARIKQGSSDYAPLARMLDEGAVRREAARAQSDPLYRMHGSGLPVKDIFDQTLVSAARLISRANRQLVTNAVAKMAQIEGMGRLIERVPQGHVRRSLNVEQIRRDLENMGVDTSVLPEGELLNYYTPADQPRGSDPIIVVKQLDGTNQWYYVAPKIYDVMNKIEPFSLRNIPHIGPVLDFVLGAPKRIFTMGTTGLRPSFSLLTNPLRDLQGWLVQTKASINPAKMAAAYFNAVGEQLRAAVTGREGPIMQAALNLGPQMSQALGRDIQYTKKASSGLFHGRIMRVVKSPIDHLRQLLNLPESFPRLAEFKRVASELGWEPGEPMSPDHAVQLAIAFKEATVDFSAAGDVSRVVNEAVPFFNPNIQGVRTAARAFRDHPLRTTLVGLSSVTGPALLLWWANKDKEWYRNLPWRERYYYTNIDDGKNVWQIPRAFEWGNLFAVMPESVLDSWYRQDPESVKRAIGHLFETQNPFDYPVLLKLAKEQWQNRIDFWDRPIVPRSEIDLTPGAQVGPYTSKPATWLGEAFPNQVSPRRVDAAIRGYFGGAVPDVLDAIGLGSQRKTRETELADAPVVGRLWRRGGFYNAQSQHLADFWEIKTNLDARSQAIRTQIRDPQRAQTIPVTDHSIIMSPVFDRAGREISLSLRIANQMRESTGKQRLYREAAESAQQLVDLYRRQEQNLEAQSRQ
jgi:hypothetical protein